jgi:ornithine cyclodeaminase/alanine dehydrogenase-like protein (mu-crystallin family)
VGRNALTAEDLGSLGALLADEPPSPSERLTVVESVGTAVLEAATGEHVLAADARTELSLG